MHTILVKILSNIIFDVKLIKLTVIVLLSLLSTQNGMAQSDTTSLLVSDSTQMDSLKVESDSTLNTQRDTR